MVSGQVGKLVGGVKRNYPNMTHILLETNLKK